jgi:putative transposase
VRKKHGPLRADTLQPVMNAAKESFVLDFVRDYRDVAVRIGGAQWRLFFETGGTNKQAAAKHLNDVCGAAPVQMASYQVQEQIDGWVSNRANAFVDCVKGSKLPDATKKQLYTINRRQLWFSREAIVGIDSGVRALARSIMWHCMGKHRHPDLSRISPRLDVRVATIEKPETADFADLWAKLRLPNRGTVAIPLHGNPQFDRRGGELCPVVQLCTDEKDRVSIRLVQDMAKPFAALRAAYEPKIERLGLDFGLATLIATGEGTLFGAGLINDLKRIDKQIVGIARHRARSGGKARDSQRYRKLVTRVRGMLKTRINATLNRIVKLHALSELAVERLVLRVVDIAGFGLGRTSRPETRTRRSITAKSVTRGTRLPPTRLVPPDEPSGDQLRPGRIPRQAGDLKDKFRITATEENAAYTSQECSLCHYVDARNRPSQSKFACRWCASVKHADVDAARVIAQRRSLGLDRKWRNKATILGVLVDQHAKRFPRPLGTAATQRIAPSALHRRQVDGALRI